MKNLLFLVLIFVYTNTLFAEMGEVPTICKGISGNGTKISVEGSGEDSGQGPSAIVK